MPDSHSTGSHLLVMAFLIEPEDRESVEAAIRAAAGRPDGGCVATLDLAERDNRTVWGALRSLGLKVAAVDQERRRQINQARAQAGKPPLTNDPANLDMREGDTDGR